MLIEQKCVLSMYASLSKYPGVCQNQYNKTQNIVFIRVLSLCENNQEFLIFSLLG